MKTKILKLSLMLCVMMSVFLIPHIADAATEGNFTYTVSGGKATITDFPEEVGGAVAIPDTLGGYLVTAIAGNAFENCSEITKITVPDSVTSIGDSAFKGCNSLEEITVPFVGGADETSNLTSKVFGYIFGYSTSQPTTGDYVKQQNGKNMDGSASYDYYYIPSALKKVTITNDTGLSNWAFYGCSNFEEINLPDTLKSIGNYAFYDCSKITDINICDGITSIGANAFKNCSQLKEIEIPKTVTSIGSDAFLNCTSISKTTMNDLESWCKITFDSDKANPTYYSKNLYLNNSLLTEVEIPDGITKLKRYVFFNCDDIKKIDVPDSVTSIGDSAFKGCNSLEEITVPFVGGADETSNLTSKVFGYIFGYSTSQPTTGDYVKQQNGKNMDGSASYDYYYIPSALKKVTITNDTGLSNWAFYGCSNFEEINLPDTLKSIGDYAFYDCSKITDVNICDGITSIGYKAFKNCLQLKEIEIPKTVTSIGSDAFLNCTSISKTTMTDLESWCKITFDSETSNPTYYSKNLYLNNSLLTEVEIPDGITKLKSYVFFNCDDIKKIIVPNSVTGIGLAAFKGCNSLEEITLPFVGDTDKGSSVSGNSVMGYVFGYSTSQASSGDYVYQLFEFYNLEYHGKYYYIPSSLKKVTITNDTGLSYGAFYGCSNFEEINLPDTLKSIGDYAFYDCSKITDVNICDGITSIGYNAFKNCSQLKEIAIPKTVTSIGSDAFLNCTSISKTIMNDLESWCKITFDSETSNPTYYSKNLYLNNSLLTEVEIPDGITKLKSYVFFNCDDIKKIIVPNSVTGIGLAAFKGCNSLEEIVLPYVGDTDKGSTSSSSVFGYIFGCSDSQPTTGDYVKQNYDYNNKGRFYYIPSSLKKVTITNDTGLPYGAFYGCSNLEEINLPDNLESVGTDAFYGTKFYNDPSCWDDGKILYVDNVLVLGSTGISGSYDVREGTTSIVGSAFKSNTKLTEITIPDSVKYIGPSAFYENTALKTVVLGNGLEEIKTNAFFNCKAISDVLYRGTNLDWNEVIIESGNKAITSTSIANESIYVRIVDTDGSVIARDITTARTTFDYSIVPAKAEHTYKLYADKELTKEFDTSAILMEDTNVYVKYIINQYTYTFYNDDGTVFKSVTADYGSQIKAPSETPVKQGNAQYTYMFVKWNDFANGLTLTENVSFTPYFTPVLNRYTYIFEDAEGGVFKKATLDYGSEILKPDTTPGKSSTAQYSYTFSRWDGFSDGITISSNVNFKPVYTPVLNRYTYTFLDGDGTVLKTGSIPYGQKIPLPTTTPTKNKDSQYSYVFEKWDLYTDSMTISADITFQPVFKGIANKYTYKFVDENGNVYFEETAEYGAEIRVPDVVPVKEATEQYSYYFTGWGGYTYGMTLTKDITFVAEFEADGNNFTYKFLNEDGSVFYSKTAEYGSVIELPSEVPQKDGAYEFDCWQGYTNGMILSENITFTAMFRSKSFSITVDGYEELNTTAVYDTQYYIIPAVKTGFKFEGYYSEPDGNGKKLTDSRGYSILKYETAQDMTVYAYFTDALMNELVITGDTRAQIGDSGLSYKVSFGTDKEAPYALVCVKYPKVLSVAEVKPVDFADVSLDSSQIQGEYITDTYLCIYSYMDENIPLGEAVDAFEITFDLSTEATPGDITVEFTEDSVILGAEDYNFKTLGSLVITVEPKLAECIEIIGDGEISGTTQYTAIVYPDYTTDKTVEWSVSDETIAKISSDGVVTPVRRGKVTVIAKSVSNPTVKVEKEITITQAASVISSLSSNTGYWVDEFDPVKREYTLIVPENTTSVSFTPKYVYGTLKCNGSTMLNNRAKSVLITEDTTTLVFNRINVPDCDDSVYNVTVIKSDDAMLFEQKSPSEFSIIFNKAKIENFENAKLIASLYDSEGILKDIKSIDVCSKDKYAEINIDKYDECDYCKLMLWDENTLLKPLCTDVQMKN